MKEASDKYNLKPKETQLTENINWMMTTGFYFFNSDGYISQYHDLGVNIFKNYLEKFIEYLNTL